MSPDQEDRMRSMLREYDTEQLINTAVEIQQVCDTHVAEKGGFTSQISMLNRQNEALRAANEQLEAETGDPTADPEELENLKHQVTELQARVDKLTNLNEKLQEKLVS